jgi:hypothetical protein
LLVDRAMRLPLIFVAILATGCPNDSDLEIVFRVVDTTGADVAAELYCSGPCDSPVGGCVVEGRVTSLGDGEHLCTIDGEAAPEVTLTAYAGNAMVDADVQVGRRPDEIVVTLWRPTVGVEEVDDQIVVTWDPSPATTASTNARIAVYAEPWVGFRMREVDERSASLPLEDFEDFADAQFRIFATHWVGGLEHRQVLEDIAAPHTPTAPASRGAACEVVYGELGREAFAAGECPVTNGVTASVHCCDPMSATVDLGAEQPIRRVLVRAFGGTIAVSTDGMTFTEVDTVDRHGAELSPPVTARYVRVDDAVQIGEISVFTP